MPESVLLLGHRVELSFPAEDGVRNDFVGCVLDDVYGLANFRQAPKTVLDIGANVGFFSLAARNYFPQATIHAYEPNPRIEQHLRHQARVAKFQVYSEAVGAGENAVNIAEVGDSNRARITSAAGDGPEIRQVTLATAVQRIGGRVDLAKIDCEGGEWDLLEAESCWHSIHNLRMEYHLWGGRSFSELSAKMRSLGFEILKHHSSPDFGMVWCRRPDHSRRTT